MAYLNTAALLDDIQTHIIDNSSNMRTRLLNWLNNSIRGLLNEPREWWFIRKQAAVSISNGAITLPADFGEFVNLTIGYTNLTKQNNLTYDEAFSVTNSWYVSGLTSAVPVGYIINNGVLTLYPTSSSDSGTLTYTLSVNTAYTDSSADTAIPVECGPYLKRCVLAAYYEFDADDRGMLAIQQQAAELRKLKSIDNMRKPIINYEEFC